jgi:hypothetical protein
LTDQPWPAEPLRSREVRHWRVRVRTDLGWTAWSEPARVEAALLNDMDWTARPVHAPGDRGRTSPGPVPLLRREFDLPAEPVSARLYSTALGVHRTAINGRPVCDDLLEPGWTSYPNRLLYATYDVTELLTAGRNALSAAVGDGWYRGHLTWHKNRDVYGDTCALLAQLEVTLADGTTVEAVKNQPVVHALLTTYQALIRAAADTVISATGVLPLAGPPTSPAPSAGPSSTPCTPPATGTASRLAPVRTPPANTGRTPDNTPRPARTTPSYRHHVLRVRAREPLTEVNATGLT